MQNSENTHLIRTKQILFGRPMAGISHDQPTKTSSLWVFVFKVLYYRR